MAQTVTLHLPDEMLRRYQQGASAARKQLEEFLVERLLEAVPPLAADVPSPLGEELRLPPDAEKGACCHAVAVAWAYPARTRDVVNPRMPRRHIPRSLRRRIIAASHNRCAYCHALLAITGARPVLDHSIA